jgi:hypothetical protein
MEMFRENDVPVAEEGEEDVAVVSPPTVNPFSCEGDGEIAVDGDGGGGTGHEETGIALRSRVDYFVQMFREEGAEEGSMSG